ncbi:hypothetical protein ACIHQR_01840 [Corallococcus coralloides]|uniref:hypothetical protein n=1 Tax=Corallococcus TaxID=83461 RepID=UPI001CBA9DF6|nr:hypothetical protein [Corallococcus sp. AS-1-12]MBZ4334016.1 hypothetical protein [Corallococcus sp. AS-1-12]
MKWMALVSCVAVALGVLVPAVAWATGWEQGPCDVEVVCGDGSTLACHGEIECIYRGGASGFVECDGFRGDCP